MEPSKCCDPSRILEMINFFTHASWADASLGDINDFITIYRMQS